jgi:hypothetical protein
VLFLLALSVLTAASVGSVFVYQKSAQRRQLQQGAPAKRALAQAPAPAAKPNTTEPTLPTLQVGDVVSNGVEDWLVLGTLAYREENERWALHHLQGDGAQWLEVRRVNGAWQAAFVSPTTAIPASGGLMDGLQVGSVSVLLEQRGDARVEVLGDCAGRSGGLLGYLRYANPQGDVVVVDEAARRFAYAGQRVVEGSLQIYSGELNRS